MSKASKFVAVYPAPFKGTGGLRAEVTGHGELYIINPVTSAIDAKTALALGHWIIDMFGEEPEGK